MPLCKCPSKITI